VSATTPRTSSTLKETATDRGLTNTSVFAGVWFAAAEMMETIQVHVVEFSDRKFYMMQYMDPLTGRKKTRSTKVERTGRKRERTHAERAAAQWESDLREGRYKEPSKVSWEEFRERYETEVLPSLADSTEEKACCVFNVVERLLRPTRLRDLTADRLSYYQRQLREMGRRESTIDGHLAHLIAAMNCGGGDGIAHRCAFHQETEAREEVRQGR